MDLPMPMLSTNLGINIEILDFSLVPCQSTPFKVTIKPVTIFLYYGWFSQEVTLKLIFIDFEILRVKVWMLTVIAGNNRYLKFHISG